MATGCEASPRPTGLRRRHGNGARGLAAACRPEVTPRRWRLKRHGGQEAAEEPAGPAALPWGRACPWGRAPVVSGREGARGERAVQTGASTQSHGRGAAFNAEHRRGSAGPRRLCRGCGWGDGPCARGRQPPAPPAAGTALGLPGLRPASSRRGSGRSGAAGGATPRSRPVPAGTASGRRGGRAALPPGRAEPAARGPRRAPAWPGGAEQGLHPLEPRARCDSSGDKCPSRTVPAVTGQSVLAVPGSPGQWHLAGTGRSWLFGSAAASSSVAPTAPDGKAVLGCHTSPGLRPSPKTAAARDSPAVLGRRDEPRARRTRRCRSRWCCAGDTTGCTPRQRGAPRGGTAVPTWTRAPRGTRRSTHRSPAPGAAAAAAARPPPPGTAAAAGRAGVTAAPMALGAAGVPRSKPRLPPTLAGSGSQKSSRVSHSWEPSDLRSCTVKCEFLPPGGDGGQQNRQPRPSPGTSRPTTPPALTPPPAVAPHPAWSRRKPPPWCSCARRPSAT